MKTIWFCGNDENKLISLAEMLGEELILRDQFVEVIVQSEVKEILGKGLKDTNEDKSVFIDRLGFLGNLLHRNNIYALIVSSEATLNDRKPVKENYKNYVGVCHGKPNDPLTDVALDEKDDIKQNAKKIIDYLVKLNLIPGKNTSAYSKEEEEEIRRRLENLGYV
ncbi:MAG: hypothetical protein HYY52_03960 [Candidatus Melainabacteria bacterium]|nr:hypothetical protein [Candidatus Melainabacteria bacterium]